MSCDFAHQDGAYVLGALSPAERLKFEQHLAGCPDCARAVRELAGLPGLLARVDPAVLETPTVEVPVPETLLPALVDGVRRTQRRRLAVTVGLAAAALVAAAVLPLAISGAVGGDRTPAAAPSPTTSSATLPAGRAMVPVGGAPVRANVALEEVPWGTRLELTCTYEPVSDDYHLPQAATYVLVVRTRDGSIEQVGTWRALEGQTMHVSAATSASRREIASVEVRATNGQRVLKLAA